MPIYEYECHECNHVEEFIAKNFDQGNAVGYMTCSECGGVCSKVISSPNFMVTGFNSSNGYNLPNYDDVIDSDGKAKKKWGKG